MKQKATNQTTYQHGMKLSETSFKKAMEYAPIGIAFVSPKGKYIRVNQAFCDIVGYSKEEVLKISWKELTYPDDIEKKEESYNKLFKNKIKTFQMITRFVHKYGHAVWVQLNASLVRDDNKKPLFAISHFQDISERKKIEDKLRESEERYRYIQKATDDVIWDWDLKKDQMYVSDNFLTTFKYDPMYISQQPFKSWWLDRIHPEDKDRIVQAWEQIIDKNKESHFSVEYRLLRGFLFHRSIVFLSNF